MAPKIEKTQIKGIRGVREFAKGLFNLIDEVLIDEMPYFPSTGATMAVWETPVGD